MDAKKIYKMLAHVDSWAHADNAAARKAFCSAMKSRQYGFDALLDAWCWFLHGWIGSDKPRTTQKTRPAPCCDISASSPGRHRGGCPQETVPAPEKWMDYGSLSNGRCAFAKISTGAACCLPEGHAGGHMTDQDYRATVHFYKLYDT